MISLSALHDLGLRQTKDWVTSFGFDPERLAEGLFFLVFVLGKDDTVEVEGEITDTLPNTQFRVKLDAGQEIIAHLSGKMRMHRIRVMPGDRVKVALSPYDLTKGRITIRL
jgi:translation initiation factor IF-1